MSNITLFPIPCGAACRTIVIDGNPWYIAKDVCNALELAHSVKHGYGHHLRSLGPEDVKSSLELGVTLPGTGMHAARWVSESGFYQLVFRSRKPEASAFRHWVCSDVLPSLRKHGVALSHPMAQALASGEMSAEELMASALEVANKELARLTMEQDKARNLQRK